MLGIYSINWYNFILPVLVIIFRFKFVFYSFIRCYYKQILTLILWSLFQANPKREQLPANLITTLKISQFDNSQ